MSQLSQSQTYKNYAQGKRLSPLGFFIPVLVWGTQPAYQAGLLWFAIQPTLDLQILGHELVRVNVQRTTEKVERVDGGHLLPVFKEANVRTDAANPTGKSFLS
jgi:hypothetical protein